MKLIYSTLITLTVIIISITIIIISIITSIIAIIINSTKNDIWDMEELFHKLTNFREQSLMPCQQKKKKVLSLFTFSSISYLRAGLGIVKCFSIAPSFISSIRESSVSGLYFDPQLPHGFDHFYRPGRGAPPYPAGRGVHPWLKCISALHHQRCSLLTLVQALGGQGNRSLLIG